jgi:hypothetical protein
MLDVFRGDAFSLTSLTDAIQKAPFKPGRLGQLGLFRSSGIVNTSVVVEEKDGRLELIQTSPRGGPATTIGQQKRTARSFLVPHLEKESTIKADEVQGVRVFGSEDASEAMQAIVNERLADLRAMHEVTLEHLRIGAIKGLIYDADGSTVIYNLYTEFGVSQQTYAIALLNASADIRNEAVAIQRLIETELGAEPVSGFRAFCGAEFFDTLVAHTNVKASFANQEGAVLRTDLRKGFEFGGITWEEYRGRVSGVDFVETDEAHVVPEGTGLFKTYFAPADFIETVNTVGRPLYAKLVEDKELQRSIKVHTQSNPLAICLRPRAVVKLTLGS